MQTAGIDAPTPLVIFDKETLVKGQPVHVHCVEINGSVLTIDGGALKIARLEDEWFEDLPDPVDVARQLSRMTTHRPDLLTFWQRLPDVEPKYDYRLEWEELAVLPVESYDRWWNHQIKSRVRTQIRKARKDGVVIREAAFDDAFVNGMTSIFNEARVRQGRRFWHYGKDRETVRAQFSRFLFREQLIGAYLGNEMIAFMMLAHAGPYALTGQIIASLRHRDKSSTNALIAAAVEICASRGIEQLVYYFWSDDSLADFKRRCGFVPIKVPRYYIPVTGVGRLALAVGAHRGLKSMIPSGVRQRLKLARRMYYDRQASKRSRSSDGSSE